MRRELQHEVETWLEETGLPWSIEPGSKHTKVFLNGRFVTVLSNGTGKEMGRRQMNVRASIRRAAREAR